MNPSSKLTGAIPAKSGKAEVPILSTLIEHLVSRNDEHSIHFLKDDCLNTLFCLVSHQSLT